MGSLQMKDSNREEFEAWHYEQYLIENPNIDITNAKYIYDYAHKNALVCQLKESHFIAWQAAKAQAVPEGFVLVPKTNSDKGIESMAMRYRHDFPLLDANYQEGIKSQMRQLYEEAVGLGFYTHKAQESDNETT